MSNRKGSRSERELVQGIRETDFRVLRIPTSGGGTSADLPDVFAGSQQYNVRVAMEAKRVAEGTVYVDVEEAEGLIRFAKCFGAIPAISGRWDGDTRHYVLPVDACERTPSGKLKIPRSRVEFGGVPTHKSLEDVRDKHIPPYACGRCGKHETLVRPEGDGDAPSYGYTQLCRSCIEEVAEVIED